MIDLLDKEKLTEKDINQLIDLKVEESIHLDFKQSDSLGTSNKRKAEIAKDVSSFANSVGGFIVYGICENNHTADSLSFVNGSEITKEWIEQVIQTRIQRKIEGLRVIPIRYENDISKTVYVIKIPESALAPHMTSDKRFYKRYNFESVQMEEYEIRDIYNRKEKTKLEINNLTTSNSVEYDNVGEIDEIVFHKIRFQIENVGNVIEKYFKLIATISFSDFTIRNNYITDVNPNLFLNSDNKPSISFSNPTPIFPGEIMTLGNINFGFPSAKKSEIIENEGFNLELIYTNGKDIMNIKLKDIIKKANA